MSDCVHPRVMRKASREDIHPDQWLCVKCGEGFLAGNQRVFDQLRADRATLVADLAAARAEIEHWLVEAGRQRYAAESMRERAAKVAERDFYACEGSEDIAAAIRALPLEEP